MHVGVAVVVEGVCESVMMTVVTITSVTAVAVTTATTVVAIVFVVIDGEVGDKILRGDKKQWAQFSDDVLWVCD